MALARLVLLVATLLSAMSVHATLFLPECRHGSALLDSVASGDLSAVSSGVKRLGRLEPDLGARALALSIKPITLDCDHKKPNSDMFALLVKLGADVNRPSKGELGLGTSLMHAVYGGHEEIVTLALKAGARVNVEINERTPLNLAIHIQSLQLVQMLLDRGAEVDFPKGRSWTLSAAATYPGQRNEILKLVIRRGARGPLDRDSPLNSLIFYNGQPENIDEAVELLLKAGEKIEGNGRNPLQTPLAEAMDSSHTKKELVKALLRRGANPNGGALYRLAMRQDYGNVELKRKQLLELLYQYGARAEKAQMKGYPNLREYVRVNSYSDNVSQAFLRELGAISREYRLRNER